MCSRYARLNKAAAKSVSVRKWGGLRLCVNQNGERMDVSALGNEVHNINILTVIASESYDSFAKGLQNRACRSCFTIARRRLRWICLRKGYLHIHGNEQVVDDEMAQAIYFDMVVNGYVDRKGALTDKYYADKANNAIKVADEVSDCVDSVVSIVDSIYDIRAMQRSNARGKNVELQVDPEKLAMPEFKGFWQKISPKSVYVVDFDTEELVDKAIASPEPQSSSFRHLFKVESGTMNEIQSKESLLEGTSFVKKSA